MLARVTVSRTVLHAGSRIAVNVSGCPHGSTPDYGVFFHDHREVALDRHDQSGLLHPTVRWSDATTGVAELSLPRNVRRGRSLIAAVCDTGNSPATAIVSVR